jgi:hypothetical protein
MSWLSRRYLVKPLRQVFKIVALSSDDESLVITEEIDCPLQFPHHREL